ncbi:glycosyltransferase family 4 protein [Vibrio superstes]|uniref:Glycosyl transferase n=1 Tax=Vibrio superstes NBRC 103154 TaxID=1219062 RepID=A0A511QLH2_9VIBR|nr:glycosyltransferase family 4 protein [Vibrio superstes]GEM78170.1 glycosyl transferase [Vibrio superstes NBRC 103154]
MNILICSSYKSNWHAVRPEAEVFVELAKKGHNITIATQGDAEYVQRFREFGIDVVDCYPEKKICLKTIKKIRQIIKSKNIEICYAYNSKTIPNAAFACIGTKAKLIAYRGTVSGLYRHDPSSYLTALHPRVDGIVCVSDAVRQDVLTKVWKKKTRIVTIYKGHDVRWYDPTPLSRADFNIPDKSKIGICVANSRPSKGVKLLLDSIKEINDPTFHLVLVGNGMEALEEYSKNFKMSERIHFLGFRKDISNLMAMSDFQIQPSISGEGLPKTIIEAMVVSKPSIVTTTGGSPELIINDINGKVVTAGNQKELTEAISYFISDESDLTSMGKASKQRMAKDFSLEKSVDDHLAYFTNLLS